MFASTAEVDPADYDKLVRLMLKFGSEVPTGVVSQARKDVSVRSRDTAGRFPQTVPIRVLTDGTQNLNDRSFNSGQIDRWFISGTQLGRPFEHVPVNVESPGASSRTISDRKASSDHCCSPPSVIRRFNSQIVHIVHNNTRIGDVKIDVNEFSV